jgi:hypothetical protein
LAVSRRRVLIDWDWGASGIWLAADPSRPFSPVSAGHWGPHVPPSDRHAAWRGLLSDSLIDRLQTWNDDGDLFMGRYAHKHDDQERIAFWARGRDLAKEVQEQLGDSYEVRCAAPAIFLG